MIRSLAPLLVGLCIADVASTSAFCRTAAGAPPLLTAMAEPKTSAAPMAVEEPRDVVAALYKLAAGDAKKAKPTSPFRDPKVRGTYFSKAFDLLVTGSETKAAQGGDKALAFDPISASPDAELQKVTLKTDLLELGKAVVSATFLNHALPTVVTYDFVKEGGAWKIDDIKGTTEKEAWSVRKILQAAGKAPTALPGMPNAAAAPDAPMPPKRDPRAK